MISRSHATVWLADAGTTAFSFAVHFQAGAVDDEIDLAVIFCNVDVDSEYVRERLNVPGCEILARVDEMSSVQPER